MKLLDLVREGLALVLVNIAFRVDPSLAGKIGMHAISVGDRLRKEVRDAHAECKGAQIQ